VRKFDRKYREKKLPVLDEKGSGIDGTSGTVKESTLELGGVEGGEG